MDIVLVLMGGFVLVLFPFILLKKAKEMKLQNTFETKKKYNLLLISITPIPIIAFIVLIIGIKGCM